MLKWIGILLVNAGCSGIGFSMKQELCRRLSQLKDILHIFELFESEVGYYKENLPGACYSISTRCESPYRECLERINTAMEANKGQTFSAVWEDEWTKCLKNTGLSEEEKKTVLQFGKSSVHMDIAMQEADIRKCGQELACAEEKIKKEIENKGRVYTSLGVAGGLVLSIILF